jgi:N-acetylglucosamine kinase-like BadF-type ATPase
MGNLIIGVDGGASGTQAILADDGGQVLAAAQAGPSNFNVVGEAGAAAALDEAVRGALGQAGRAARDLGVVALGLAGLNHPDDQARYARLIAGLNWGADIVLENDVVIAWAGATRCRPGVAVIAGTGCNAFGINARGERRKASGWDWLLADEGSGYWIGVQGMRAAMRAYDGRGPATRLSEAVKEEYGLQDVPDLIQIVYAPGYGKTEAAGFAKRVSACAEQGDAVALAILRQAGEELALAANTVIRRLELAETAFDLGLTGGVFRAGGPVLETFSAAVQAVAPRCRIAYVRYPPSIGALFLAFQRSGRLDDALVARLEASSGELLERLKSKT